MCKVNMSQACLSVPFIYLPSPLWEVIGIPFIFLHFLGAVRQLLILLGPLLR